jgi:ADP-heptose:LPS heptosyltransferase
MGLAYRLPLGLVLPKPAEGSAVLLIRDDGIGDLAYNAHYTSDLLTKAGYTVYAVVKEAFLDVGKLFLTEDRLIPIDSQKYRKNLTYRFQFLSSLRKIGFAAALGSVIASSLNCDLLRYCGAKEKWGYLRSNSIRNIVNYRGIKTAGGIAVFSEGKYIPTLAHEAAIVSTAFPAVGALEFIPPKITYKPPKPFELPEKYILYLPEAGNMRRCCPSDTLIPVLTDIFGDLPLVVLGSRESKYKNGGIINLTGRTSLKQALSIVLNAASVIGNESGLAHIAWISGIPTALFLGGGHWGRFLPLDTSAPNPFIISKPMDCFCCGWKCKYNEPIFKCVNFETETLYDVLGEWQNSAYYVNFRPDMESTL